MTLTIQIGRREDGQWKASLIELPGIFYLGPTKAEVEEHMGRLVHALRSPHIKIERILPDGDVILSLDRAEEEDDESDSGGRTLHSVALQTCAVG